MANRKKLSCKSRERIKQKINALGGDEALSKKATKLVLSKLKSSIEQNNPSDTYTKNIIIEINKKNCTITIEREKNNKEFVNIVKKNCYKTLEKLIDNQRIIVSGISAGTCTRFRQGEKKIDSEAFNILCETLGENWENVCEPTRKTLGLAATLNLELCKFNYRSEKKSFRKRTDTYHSLYLRKLTVNNYSCHWLLKSLIINQSQECDHCIIPLNILNIVNINSKSKNALGHKILLEVIKNLKKIKSSQIQFTINKNSTIPEISRVLQQILQKQSIIFLVQSLDEIGVPTGEAVIKQFWNLITDDFSTTKHHLFLCFFSMTEIQCQSIGYNFGFEVGKCFNDKDLSKWLNQLEDNHYELFKKIIKDEDDNINLEVERIWGQCQGNYDCLLEEIHLSCGCTIEETLWQRI